MVGRCVRHTILTMAEDAPAPAAAAAAASAAVAPLPPAIILPPLKSIWDSPMMLQTQEGIRKMMECGHCNMRVVRNPTKLMYHAAKMPGGDIKCCTEAHSPEYTQLYREYFTLFMAKQASKRAFRREVLLFICYYFIYIIIILIYIAIYANLITPTLHPTGKRRWKLWRIRIQPLNPTRQICPLVEG